MSQVKIETIRPDHADALEQLQRDCFPQLGDDDLMRAEHFLKHAEICPDFNFVALIDGRVVGLGAGFLCDFDFDHPNHAYMDFIADGYYTNHKPDGAWYYGSDISVHPDFRRRGIGNRLYKARKGVVKRLNKRGIVAGGLVPSYARYKDKMTVHEYVDKVVSGEIYGRTLTFQLNQGFKVRGMIENYLEDDISDNWATLIVWDNPDYKAEA